MGFFKIWRKKKRIGKNQKEIDYMEDEIRRIDTPTKRIIELENEISILHYENNKLTREIEELEKIQQN